MNVVLSGKTIALAADEVTQSGERLPLTNFQSWPYEPDQDEAKQFEKFEALLESRDLSPKERKEIMSQAKEVLRVIRGNSVVQACDTLHEMQEDIWIRDGREIRRRAKQEKEISGELDPLPVVAQK
eukprot:CAMPEP_0184488122 /NCGR_PEP_ID=MMETSP0113_2-20130426/10538_1 /TAXON_ID=91329 /ORGANISM="Norrisiella sphaerica, Strain BC52" /LENGTH=125 /DNA_ID=CAMNT_0026870601 /DNA_START=306 /DNA_END=683 /DNA_ORIENTATION=-